MLVNARQIRAFLAVAKAESFTRAAEQLHLSQSALSAQIQQLEDMVGMRLIDRNRRHVSLNIAGREFLPRFENILRELEAIATHSRDLSDLTRGTVSIAAIPSVAEKLLPRAIAAVTSNHPGVSVHVRDAVAQKVVDLVKRGEVDFGIASIEKPDRELSVETLTIERFCAFVPADHPAMRESAYVLGDLLQWPLILPVPQSSIRMAIDAAASRAGLQVPPRYEVVYTSTIFAFVRHGLGIAILPQSMARNEHDCTIRTIAIDTPCIERHIAIIRPANRSMSPAALAFIEALKQQSDIPHST